MASKKVGTLVKEARTAAGLTQEKLAKAAGVTASDISKVERGEADLTNEQLKKVAKATGVTQTSLISAPKNTSAKSAAAKKTTTTAKKAATTAKKTTSTVKKTTSSKTTAKKNTSSAAQTSMKVTAAEKKLVEAYRKASTDAKKAALYLLAGESEKLLDNIIRNHSSGSDGGGLGDWIDGLFK